MMVRHKYIRRLFIFLTIVGVLGVVTSILAPGERNTNALVSYIMMMIGAPLIVFLFFTAFIFLFSLLIVKFKPHLVQGVTYKFTQWGIERSGQTSESTTPWRDFRNIKELKNFFILEFKEKGLDNAYAIKKGNFESKSDQIEFKDFIEYNFSNAAK